MDFKGQKLAEQLCLYIILAAGALAFVTGWYQGSFAAMMKVYGGGVAVAMLACVPDWPYFNTQPESWLPSQKDALKVAAGTKLVAAR